MLAVRSIDGPRSVIYGCAPMRGPGGTYSYRGERRRSGIPAGWRPVIRLAVWTIGVVISIFPALHAAHVKPTIHFKAMAIAVNNAGDFRDFFFVVIIVSVQSLSNVLDKLVRNINDIEPVIGSIAVLLCLYYIYVLFYGGTRFSDLSMQTGPVPPDSFSYDFTFISILLCISIVTEAAISLANDG